VGTLLASIRKRKKAERGLRTILDQTGALFDLSSSPAFGRDLLQRMLGLLPRKTTILLLRYPVADAERGADRPKLVHPAMASDPRNPAGGTTVDDLSSRAMDMIRKAREDQRSLFASRDAVVYFDDAAMPVNLACIRTPAAMD